MEWLIATALTIDFTSLARVVAIISAIGVIGGVFMKLHKMLNRFEHIEKHETEIDKKLADFESEQCMQTYVLQAVLDGLHQLGCNGKTTEASEKLSKFINQKAHNQVS